MIMRQPGIIVESISNSLALNCAQLSPVGGHYEIFMNNRYDRKVFTLPQSVGIMGGRPQKAFYFVGCQVICAQPADYSLSMLSNPALSVPQVSDACPASQHYLLSVIQSIDISAVLELQEVCTPELMGIILIPDPEPLAAVPGPTRSSQSHISHWYFPVGLVLLIYQVAVFCVSKSSTELLLLKILHYQCWQCSCIIMSSV